MSTEAELKADFDRRQAAGEKTLATAEKQEELKPFDASPITPKAKG
jgi:hypothetical protein